MKFWPGWIHRLINCFIRTDLSGFSSLVFVSIVWLCVPANFLHMASRRISQLILLQDKLPHTKNVSLLNELSNSLGIAFQWTNLGFIQVANESDALIGQAWVTCSHLESARRSQWAERGRGVYSQEKYKFCLIQYDSKCPTTHRMVPHN